MISLGMFPSWALGGILFRVQEGLAAGPPLEHIGVSPERRLSKPSTEDILRAR